MFYRRIMTSIATIALALSATTATFATGATNVIPMDKKTANVKKYSSF
jgi:hypothetical protein